MNIELPNGHTAEFPDEMPLDQIKSIIRQKFPPHKPGILERAGNDVEQHINKPIEEIGRGARDMAAGFGQGIANIAPGLGNLGISGINALLPNRRTNITDLISVNGPNNKGMIPHIPMIDMVPHTPSGTAGEVMSFFAPGSFMKLLSKAPAFMNATRSAMKIPMIAESVKHASNILGKRPMASRIAGNALLGGAYSPESPLLGMGLGAVGGLGAEAVNKGYKGIKNSLENNELLKKTVAKFNPAAHQKELEHHLSGGANNITENSRLLGNDIRNAHAMREEEAGAFYNHALKSAGHEPIYGVGHSDIIPSKVPDYVRQESTIGKIKGLKVGDLFNTFKSNPNFSNAHRLKSELGSMERQLKANPLKTQDDLAQIRKVESAKIQLNDDINHFLEKRDLTSNNPIAGHYKKGNELFQAHVAPYLSDPKLVDIVKGGQTAVKDLHKVFDTPSNIITKEGMEKIGSINKIMKDLPESSRNRIIFDAIGGNKLSPEALVQKLDEIKSKGFESYFTPEIEESIKQLTNKLKKRNIFKNSLKATGAIGALGAADTGVNAIKHLF